MVLLIGKTANSRLQSRPQWLPLPSSSSCPSCPSVLGHPLPPLTVPFPGAEHPMFKHCRRCCLVNNISYGGGELRVSHFSITIQGSYNFVVCKTWRITGFLDLIFVVVWIFAPVHWEIQKSTCQQEAGSLERKGCGLPAYVNSTSSNFSKVWPPKQGLQNGKASVRINGQWHTGVLA